MLNKGADYDSMRQFVRNTFGNMDYASFSASTQWHKFNTVLQEAIRFFVPVSTNRGRRSKPLWITGKVRSVKKKHKLWLKWRHHHDDNDLVRYKRQANKASKAVKLVKKNLKKMQII